MRFQQGPPCEAPEITKELSISQVLTIPAVKPSLAETLDSCADVSIDKATVLDTLLVQDGQPVKKAVISGEAEVTVKYEAAVVDQQVHAAVFRIPFDTLVEWPGGPPSGNPICVNATIEHSQVDTLTDRNLFGILVIRVDFYRH